MRRRSRIVARSSGGLLGDLARLERDFASYQRSVESLLEASGGTGPYDEIGIDRDDDPGMGYPAPADARRRRR